MTNKLSLRLLAAAALSALLAAPTALAQVSITAVNTPFSENFDTLATSGTTNAWADNVTLVGWYSQFQLVPANPTTYRADAGTSNTGAIYSYGTGTATERAFGSVSSGTPGTIFNAVRLVNNTGGTITSLMVGFTGEQWRNGGNTSAQQLDFQYQVGAPGAITDANTPSTGWTDVNSLDFVSPVVGATAAALDGNAAANRTAKLGAFLVTINAGEEVWLRWADANDSGNDHGLAVDDFSVTANPVGVTFLTINDVTLAEGDSGTTTFQFTVSLSTPSPVGGVTFDIATADNTATTADNDYVANSVLAASIPAGNTSYTFDVTVNGDTTVEPNESFFVNVTNPSSGLTIVDGQGQGTITNDDVTLTKIHDIQGPGASSPLVGQVVTTRGIVTGVKSNGFFIQEPDAGVDADPLTSEGVFVFTSSAPPAPAVVGNLVQVSATVAEYIPTADPLQPPLTELTTPTVSLLSSGNPLPAAIPLTATFPDPAGSYAQLERIEGMRASVASLTVVAPTQGNLTEASATSTTNGVFFGVVTGVARPFREAGIQDPDPAAPPLPRFDTNPERIRVDGDGLTGGTAVDVATDAVITGLVGPVDYAFRTYTILQDPATTLVVTGGKTATAVTTPTNLEFTVASYNMERFYNDVDDAGGDVVLTTTAYNNRLNKASLAIRNQLKFPDILGVVEMENLATLQALAAKVNADAVASSQPNPLYVAYLVEGNDIGLIDVGFLVKTAEVQAGVPRVSVTEVVQERAGTLFVNPDTSTSLLNDRPPLRFTGAVHHPNGSSFALTVIANHLRSLNGIDSTAAGTAGWATEGDRVRAKRQKQAEDLADLVQDRQVADPGERIVLVGDFNAFEVNDGYVDSMDVIKGTPVPDNQTVVPGDGVDLVNPDFTYALETLPAERYSYSFDGNAQTIDHVLANANVVSGTSAMRAEHPRINADFPETARNSAASPVRLSDHDPVVAYFEVAAFPVELESFSIE